MANDSWINWGDFVGANEAQLKAYDAKVQQSQAEQQAAMQAALAQLGTTYDKAATDEEQQYADSQKYLDQQQLYPYGKPSQSSTAPSPGSRPSDPQQNKFTSAAQYNAVVPKANVIASGDESVTRGQNGIDLSGGQKSIDTSYSSLIAAQNAGQANAFKGYQSTSGPGWQNAMYGARTQYTDPWADAQKQADTMKTQYAARSAADKAAYDASVAARKAQQGTTTKPTSTAADGTPVYGQQDDSGPRNTAIKPPKPLEGVKGYA
jgi:hypothetical protein